MDLIQCKKLSIGYSDKCVCKDISFAVERGQFVCLVGENGCGKSTLLKTLLGLNKPLSGKLIFDKEFNKHRVGYLPQQTEAQRDFPATVLEVVMSGFLNQMGLRPFYNKSEKAKAMRIMSELKIEDVGKKSFKDLSGGQQQKVLLARALCATDELLVLDEPTNALDVRSRKKLYSLISNLNKSGLTIIMVSHNLEEVIKYATHIVYLKDTLQFAGSKEEFIESEHAVQYNVAKEGNA